MGNDASIDKRRFAGGRLIEKYWVDIKWIEHQELLEKLNVDERTGYVIYRVFITIDTDEREKVTSEQCDTYINSAFGLIGFVTRKTKYTSRIFHYVGSKDDLTEDEILEGAKPGMNFQEFFLLLWNYCSLTPSQLARHLFEIYDADNIRILEKAGIIPLIRDKQIITFEIPYFPSRN